MLAGLTTNVELLMLALDVIVEAEQLVSLTIELVYVSMDAGLTFYNHLPIF